MYYANVYYGGNDYRDYIAHFGVKGMKWGKHLFGEVKKLTDKYITGRTDKNLGNWYRQQARLSTNKANSLKKQLGGSGFAGTNIKNNPAYKEYSDNYSRAADYNERAKQHRDAYNRSLFGRVNKARLATKRTITNIRNTGKKIGQFAKSTIDRGRSLISGAVNSIKSKPRSMHNARDLKQHQKNPTYDGSKNKYSYAVKNKGGSMSYATYNNQSAYNKNAPALHNRGDRRIKKSTLKRNSRRLGSTR